MRRRLLDPLLMTATVHSVRELAPRWRHIILAVPQLDTFQWQPGQHARVQVGDHDNAFDWVIGNLRTYSVWNHDRTDLHLRVFDHGDGPGAQWSRTVRPGHQTRIRRPEGNFFVREAPYHIFAGDETAAVAFGAMLNTLPPDIRTYTIIEVDTPDERLHDINHQPRWCYRRGRSAAASTTLVSAVAALKLPKQAGMAYLAGEARTIQLVRHHLVNDRGWHRNQVRTKPFWTPGRTGMD